MGSKVEVDMGLSDFALAQAIQDNAPRLMTTAERLVSSIERFEAAMQRLADAADVAVLAIATQIEGNGSVEVRKGDAPEVTVEPDPWHGVAPNERYRFRGLPGYPSE